MDKYDDQAAGDLTDIVRPATNSSSSPPMMLMNWWRRYHGDDDDDVMMMNNAAAAASFGDPFFSDDPLLLHIGSSSNNSSSPTTLATSYDNIFSRMLQISTNNIITSSSSSLIHELDTIRSVPLRGTPPTAPPPNPGAIKPRCRKSSVNNSDELVGKKKKVVCIPAAAPNRAASGGGGEVVPCDLWAWRKYGQKPIKGSPYPRGYYRCSTSKGCSARKQVERSRTDPTMLVITYSSDHNHPWPTQRNALAGSTRTPSKNNIIQLTSVNSNAAAASKISNSLSQLEFINTNTLNMVNGINNNASSSSTDRVKEEIHHNVIHEEDHNGRKQQLVDSNEDDTTTNLILLDDLDHELGLGDEDPIITLMLNHQQQEMYY